MRPRCSPYGIYYRNAERYAKYHIPEPDYVWSGRALCGRDIGRSAYFTYARPADLCEDCARLARKEKRSWNT